METTLAQTYLAAWLEYEAKAAHFNSLIRNHAPAHEAGAELDAARLVVEAHKAAIIEHGAISLTVSVLQKPCRSAGLFVCTLTPTLIKYQRHLRHHPLHNPPRNTTLSPNDHRKEVTPRRWLFCCLHCPIPAFCCIITSKIHLLQIFLND